MLVYEGIKSGFIDDVDLGIIADKIRNKLTYKNITLLNKINGIILIFFALAIIFTIFYTR